MTKSRHSTHKDHHTSGGADGATPKNNSSKNGNFAVESSGRGLLKSVAVYLLGAACGAVAYHGVSRAYPTLIPSTSSGDLNACEKSLKASESKAQSQANEAKRKFADQKKAAEGALEKAMSEAKAKADAAAKSNSALEAALSEAKAKIRDTEASCKANLEKAQADAANAQAEAAKEKKAAVEARAGQKDIAEQAESRKNLEAALSKAEAKIKDTEASLETAKADAAEAHAALTKERNFAEEAREVARTEAARAEDAMRAENVCATERAELLGQCGRSSRTAIASSAATLIIERGNSASWPDCLQNDVAMRGPSEHALKQDLSVHFGDVATGCASGNCTASDRLAMPFPGDCARLCAASPRCAFWSHGGPGDSKECVLRTAGGKSEKAQGYVSAERGCVPQMHTDASPAQTAIAVLDSIPLEVCEKNGIGAACPDLHDAMRTWKHGIIQLTTAVEGTQLSSSLATLIRQVLHELDVGMSIPSSDAQFFDVYATVAYNSRQVIEAARKFLEPAVESAGFVNKLDVSVPRPARGLLCRGDCA